MRQLLLSSFFLLCVTSYTYPQQSELKLEYLQPANEWMESTPLGNGRLGAMIYGGIEKDIIALNETTMWSGSEDPHQERDCGKTLLNKIRTMFFEGKIEEGNDAASRFLSGTPHSFGTHLPIGDLNISFQYGKGTPIDYKRVLNLRDAITRVSFKIGGTSYQREYFCSNPDDVLVIKYTASKKGALNASMSLNLLRDAMVTVEGNELCFSGAMIPGVAFTGKIKVKIKGGSVQAAGNQLSIEQADEILVLTDIRTDFKSPDYKRLCEQTINHVSAKAYEMIKSSHIADYSELFSRVELSLGTDSDADMSTAVRWANAKKGKDDPMLDVLLFQYGRYLLISASRANSPLPINLQGAWNDNLACNMGWTCDYHLDINTEQNYWNANVTNLAECNIPLFNYIKDLSEYGERTAQKVYGSPGWVAHTIANVWGYTAPGGDVNWGLFPTASCWIASHLWTHYSYTQDVGFLKNIAYPILKKNALFFLDYMTEDPKTGYLMTGPSTSPENSFLYNNRHLAISMMPTCDKVLVTETYNACIESSKILGIDADFRDSLREALKRFPPFQTGKNGGVQEWFEDFEEAHPNHRHISHLLAVYPFSQISLRKTPELAQAARKTLQLRENAEGWEDVEWSRANLICNYARLKDTLEAYGSVKMLERDFTRENLFSISPKGIAGAPWDIFIIDGNTAVCAGIAEMLLQDHEGYIEFLPALPKQWNTGNFKGLCTRGGAEVSLNWTGGTVKNATIKATATNEFRIKLPENKSNIKFMKNGKKIKPSIDATGIVSLKLTKGDIVEVRNQV